MKTVTVVIPGSFPGLNQYVCNSKKIRGRFNVGAQMKKRDQKIIRDQLPAVRFSRPVKVKFSFYSPNSRMDPDNISAYFHKVFLDALVEKGAIPSDSHKWVKELQDLFYVEKGNPRIEVFIQEGGL